MDVPDVVKLPASFFGDWRIKLLQSMHDGDTKTVIWMQLLLLGASQKTPGRFAVSDVVPYDIPTFAAILGRPEEQVAEALDAFAAVGLVENDDGVISIPAQMCEWYTSTTAEERKAETRAKVAKHRAAEKAKKVTTPSDFEIILEDGTFYNIPQEDIAQYKINFPDLDIEQELRNMAAWAMAAGNNRKTRKGAPRFVSNWLIRSQDNLSRRGRNSNGSNRGYSEAKPVPLFPGDTVL